MTAPKYPTEWETQAPLDGWQHRLRYDVDPLCGVVRIWTPVVRRRWLSRGHEELDQDRAIIAVIRSNDEAQDPRVWTALTALFSLVESRAFSQWYQGLPDPERKRLFP